MEEDAPEVLFAAEKADPGTSDLAMMQYLKSIGADWGAYGYTDEMYDDCLAALQTDPEDVYRQVREEITDVCPDVEDKDIGKCEDHKQCHGRQL